MAPLQWRVFTDMGRELVQQGRHSEAERYFKKAVEMARWVPGDCRTILSCVVQCCPRPLWVGCCARY